jgi:hypothetical protein
MIILSSNPVSAAPPVGIIEDCAPPYINESSEPVCVLNLNLSDDDGAMLLNITITVENISTFFDPTIDLALLTGDNSSGIMIYRESNMQPGFQIDDNLTYKTPTIWIGSGPWYTSFVGINDPLPPNSTGQNYYVVIRTNTSIINDEQFRVGIEASGIESDQGNIPMTSNWSNVITADTLAPNSLVSVVSENPVVKVGDWLNITAIIAGDDAISVTVNLTEFNGL